MIPIETDALFAIPSGITQIPSEICDVLKTLEGSEQRSGKTDVFNVLDEYPNVKRDITDIFSLWINSVLCTKEQKWAMTTSWVTLNPSGSNMVTHRHFNCMYSGVLYFDKVEETHPPLEFLSPLIDHSSFLLDTPIEERNVFNTDRMLAPISEGRMIFFPSYIYHGHPDFKTSGTVRKSFACNFIPIGKYGRFDSTLNTQWMTQ
tara:strand:- start:98 stop:709 length:612 start_codon:yes stop_codon:yes gene_type:complete